METVREPLLILNEDLSVASANRAFYSTFAVSPGETMGRKIFDLGDGQWNIPKLRALLDAVVPSDTPFNDFTVSHDFPGIGYKTMLLNARKLYRPGNHTTHLLLAIEDVTLLRAATERERLLLESSRDFAFLLLDRNGVIEEWKGGAEAITGWSEAEVVGQVCDLLFTPEDRAQNRPAVELGLAGDTGRAEDRRWHMKKDGSRFFADGVMIGLRDEDGVLRGYAKVLRDGTARKRAEDNLQAAYARERNIAEVLQAPLTRPIPPHAFPGLEVVTLYESALDEAEVGGDFFDAFPLEQVTVALAIADASGKGLAAAVRAMQVKEVLQAFAQEYPDSPTRIVERLNVFLCDDTRAPSILEDTGNSGFVCLALAILNPETGEGAILSAGCEPPLLLRASSQTEILEAPGIPLGIFAPHAYQALPLRMEPGDILLMATDGITEARAENKAFLGYEGFARLAIEGHAQKDGDLNALGRFILEGARTFGSGSLRDDACLLLARRR